MLSPCFSAGPTTAIHGHDRHGTLTPASDSSSDSSSDDRVLLRAPWEGLAAQTIAWRNHQRQIILSRGATRQVSDGHFPRCALHGPSDGATVCLCLTRIDLAPIVSHKGDPPTSCALSTGATRRTGPRRRQAACPSQRLSAVPARGLECVSVFCAVRWYGTIRPQEKEKPTTSPSRRPSSRTDLCIAPGRIADFHIESTC